MDFILNWMGTHPASSCLICLILVYVLIEIRKASLTKQIEGKARNGNQGDGTADL